MIPIKQDYSLRKHNTFGVDIAAKAFAAPASREDIVFLLEYAERFSMDTLVIGEGSNLLFTGDYDGLVICPGLTGIEQLEESGSEVLVRSGAGVNWDDFTRHCAEKGWYGPENLALIPGTVGSSPVQNIGAYGVEVSGLIEEVIAIDRENGSTHTFSNGECQFDYRSSVFKHALKNRFIVTDVVFRLKKHGELKLDYGTVSAEFEKRKSRTLRDLRETIIGIRRGKLPDVEDYGNAGSFFKNPVISVSDFASLEQDYDVVPHYPNSKGIKVPAAWLIDQSGLKGFREGNVGTWPKQPLVIVNYGDASGTDILEFSQHIQTTVKEKFGISLEREVQVI